MLSVIIINEKMTVGLAPEPGKFCGMERGVIVQERRQLNNSRYAK
jgi:hypothetical protein